MDQTPPTAEEQDRLIRGFSDEVVQQLLSFGTAITQELNQTLGGEADRNIRTVRFCAALAMLATIHAGLPLESRAAAWLSWAGMIPVVCALGAFQRALRRPPEPEAPAAHSAPTEQDWFQQGFLHDAARLRQAHLTSLLRCHQQRQEPAADTVTQRWIVACLASAAAVRFAAILAG